MPSIKYSLPRLVINLILFLVFTCSVWDMDCLKQSHDFLGFISMIHYSWEENNMCINAFSNNFPCELLICNCTCLWIYRINSAIMSYDGYMKQLNQATWQLQFLKWPVLSVIQFLSCSSVKQKSSHI